MAKLRRGTQAPFTEAASIRLRAAWLYYSHGLTQKEVADRLGLSRTTIMKLLDESKARGEVKIWIEEGLGECTDLATRLEDRFGLDEAIVVPAGETIEQISSALGLALGRFLSEAIPDDVTIGVGWGRTLSASLASLKPARRTGVKVLSLQGGAVESQFANPVEFSWRLAGILGAECYLFPAPLIVDSPQTKARLIEACGLDKLYRLAETLDIAVMSVGDIGPQSTSLARHLLGKPEFDELVALGAVADVMCNFIDREGRSVPHAINERVMSIELDTVANAGHRVLAAGGRARAVAIAAALKRLRCNTLVTEESAARAMLALPQARQQQGRSA